MEAFVVGFDMGKEYSQICCWNAKMQEPSSVSVVSGAQRYRIPTESLDLFLKKALRLLKPYGRLHEAAAVVFSVPEASEEKIARIRRTAMQVIGVPESRIYVQSFQESFGAYVLNQPREIWRHQALLFFCSRERLEILALQADARMTPVLVRVETLKERSFAVKGLTDAEKDEKLQEEARRIFSERPVSSVFLVGEGFDEKWYEGSLKFLCGSGRRVFAGNNLFAKGACCRAMLEARPAQEKKYLYLGEDKISYNVGLRTPGAGKNAVHTLLRAGTSWYEAKAECQALLCSEPVVEFILKPMQGDKVLRESLSLSGLPDRPLRATRLRILAEFRSVDKLWVQVFDLGFGELYPSSDLSWGEEVDLSKLPETAKGAKLPEEKGKE